MKTAIIEVNELQFNVEAILQHTNDEHIFWINTLIENKIDEEYWKIFKDAKEFVSHINKNGFSADCKYVTIDYTEWTGYKFSCVETSTVYCILRNDDNYNLKQWEKIYNGKDNTEVYDWFKNASFEDIVKEAIRVNSMECVRNDCTAFIFSKKLEDATQYAGSGTWFRTIDIPTEILNNIPVGVTSILWPYGEYEGIPRLSDIGIAESNELTLDEYNRQVEVDKAVERANGELAECIEILHNCKNLEEVYDIIGKQDELGCDADFNPNQDCLDVDYKHISFKVLSQCDGGIMISGGDVDVCDDDNKVVWTGRLEELGVTGVESQDDANIYLKPDEPEQTQEEDDDIDFSEWYPMDEDGESCFMLTCKDYRTQFYLSVFVDSSTDMFSWKLYDKDFKLVHSDWSHDTSEEVWIELFSPDSHGIGEYTGRIADICYMSPRIFNHLLKA